ncbi:MAG: N-acetyltransferase [Corynebacterium pollutisoli]|uniref:N-acetyltransferase n=1 Tax=Corynebacterium pollutisoli TaxID=1610489 RepID=A0A7X8MWI7_9CORY|nr:N-acetyltransferase [Corynebacterium pollutisoli]
MTHDIRNDTGRNRYILTVDGEEAGYLSYIPCTGAVDLEHTEIAESHAGQGLAGELARHALSDIRDRGLNAMITCPAVASFVAKNPEFADLVVEP